MSDVLEEYFAALERLKEGRPTRVELGTKITKDSVALEAGRSKGAIKKSRIIFKDLITAINETKDINKHPLNCQKISALETEIAFLRKNLEDAYGRELSLLHENHELKKKVGMMRADKVISFKTHNGVIPPKNNTDHK